MTLVIAGSFGDTDYRKAEKQLIFDLIEQSNPGFKDKAPIDSIIFETPVAIATLPTGENTSIVVKGLPGSGVIGRKTVTYRRIDLVKLFKSRTLLLTKYTVSNSLPNADLLTLIFEQWGINIDSTSFSARSTSIDTQTSLAILGSSLCYTGTIFYTWTKGKRPISEMFPTGDIDGRDWPAGVVEIGDGVKPQGEYICYDTDFTATMGNYFNVWGNGIIFGKGAESANFTNVLKALVPDIAWVDDDASVYGGFVGLVFNRYVIPSGSLPEANSGLYNRCVVLSPPAGKTVWFYGKLMFHYRA